jgi:NAD(P)-dependent dehydrogenase (short-subunit alcohol dehydrogenase family)
MDITDAGAMAHLCRGIYDRWGKVDLWVHAAIHAPPLSPADHVDAKDWDKSIKINAAATATLIPMVAPLLRGEGASAVFLDDPRTGQKFFGAYAASKAAQIALARAWAAETERNGPKVHILTPDPMPTATRARFFPGEDRGKLESPQTVAERLLAELFAST